MRPIFVVVGRQVQQENTPFFIPDFPFHTRKHKTSDREVEVVGIVVAFTLTAVAFRECFFPTFERGLLLSYSGEQLMERASC